MLETEIIYGLHSVQALLKSAPQRIECLYLLRNRQDQRLKKIHTAAKQSSIPCQILTKKELDQLCDGNHQGIVARVESGELFDESYLFNLLDKLTEDPLILVLDGVTDPHNLGACLRTANAAGAHALVIPKNHSASLTATARKVASGAAEYTPVVPVTNLARALKKMQDKGIWIIGAAGEAELSLYEAPLSGPLALVMGAEGDGLRRLTKECCDHLVCIPMVGQVSSLNVSVATGIALFEVMRRKLLPT